MEKQTVNHIKKRLLGSKKWIVVGATAAIGLAAIIWAASFLFHPLPTAQYFVKVLDRVGAPSGFTIDHSRDRFDYGALARPDVRRAFIGSGEFETVRTYFVDHLRSVGFTNAHWRKESGTEAAGVIATCKGQGQSMAVLVSIDQAGDDPIDIEVYGTDNQNAPDCPNL